MLACSATVIAGSPVGRLVVTAARHGDRARQLPVERIGTARFRAPVVLDKGRFTIDVIAHTREGDVRLRGSFDLMQALRCNR